VVLPLAVGQVLLEVWQKSSQMASGGPRLPEWPGSMGTFIELHLPGLMAQSSSLWFFLAAATVLMLLGLGDDLWKINWRVRLAVEFAVAAAVVYIPGWRLTLFVDLPLLTDIVTVLWIVGLVNSINFLDNMDGLAGGVSAIAATLLAIYMLIVPEAPGQPQLFIAGFLFLLVGSLVGFLWHNRSPARLFMGDAGSYFVGFSLAVMTTLATFSGPGIPRHSILAPVCVLAVPLYDTLSVVVIRLRNGRSPFEGDTNHFSHRLVALGLSKVQAVLTIYLTTAACGLGALVLPQVDSTGAALIVLVIGCLLGVIAILEVAARRRVRES
jgi:UDP-GlcNAc:undecaprenyl-phosphate GlcNAc-1-phosphate transferase